MPGGRGRYTGGSPTDPSTRLERTRKEVPMTTPNPFDAALLLRAQRSEEHAATLVAPEQAHQRRALLREAQILRGLADRNTAERSTAVHFPSPSAAAP